MTTRRLARSGSAALLLAAATATVPAADAPAAAGPVDPVFDCYAANSAWGLSYSGAVVDRDGQVWTYARRGVALPELRGDGGPAAYAAGDLLAKFAGATTANRIDASVLAEHVASIEKAAAGKMTSTDTGVRDAGSSTCHAYLADAAKTRYRDVELGSDGGAADRRIVNDAPDAQALLAWLRSVGVAR